MLAIGDIKLVAINEYKEKDMYLKGSCILAHNSVLSALSQKSARFLTGIYYCHSDCARGLSFSYVVAFLLFKEEQIIRENEKKFPPVSFKNDLSCFPGSSAIMSSVIKSLENF